MAEKQESPFTNTRLMIVGIVLGVVGAIMVYIYAQNKIGGATGGTVTVYFMKDDLPKEKELREGNVEARKMPGRFLGENSQLATDKSLQNITGSKPIRDMKAGEPVVLLNFSYSEASINPQTRPGMVQIAIPVDPKLSGGTTLHVGSIVNLRGNFNFSDRRSIERTQEVELCVLRAVQVVLVNGLRNPEPRDLRQMQTIAVDVSPETSALINRLMPRLDGSYTLEVLRDDTRASEPADQVPPETRAVVVEKLGLSGVPKGL